MLTIWAPTLVGFAALLPSVTATDGGPMRRAVDYTFDLFSGLKVQTLAAGKAPSELEYTLGGGVPSALSSFIVSLDN